MTADELAAWLAERGWDVDVRGPRIVAAERGGRHRRDYVLEETFMGRRWTIVRRRAR